jgi:hypothetical protein
MTWRDSLARRYVKPFSAILSGNPFRTLNIAISYISGSRIPGAGCAVRSPNVLLEDGGRPNASDSVPSSAVPSIPENGEWWNKGFTEGRASRRGGRARKPGVEHVLQNS